MITGLTLLLLLLCHAIQIVCEQLQQQNYFYALAYALSSYKTVQKRGGGALWKWKTCAWLIFFFREKVSAVGGPCTATEKQMEKILIYIIYNISGVDSWANERRLCFIPVFVLPACCLAPVLDLAPPSPSAPFFCLFPHPLWFCVLIIQLD